MEIQELTDYKITSITYPNWQGLFARTFPVIDEGSFFRIAEVHIIEKHKIASIEKENKKIIITYKDGKKIELGIVV